MPASNKDQSRQATKPEKKIGPFPSGIGVAVWLNTVQTADGPKRFRSVTINPRRYKDAKTGQWQDSYSYRASDLPALIFALQQAAEFVFTSPIPGEKPDTSTIPF